MIDDRELRAKAYELSAGVCRPEEADRADRGAGAQRPSGPPRGRDVDDAPPARDGAGHGADRRAARHRERRCDERAIPEAGAPRDRQGDPRLAHRQSSARRWRRSPAPARISQLVGRAGTGKGVVLSAAARAWQLEGYEVIGTAVAGATAQRLGEDANLDRSYTADGLCNGVENGNICLGPRTVVFMDEAGMADTERLSRLTELTADSRSKLVLAGDAAQLSPIGAGGLFDSSRIGSPAPS